MTVAGWHSATRAGWARLLAVGFSALVVAGCGGDGRDAAIEPAQGVASEETLEPALPRGVGGTLKLFLWQAPTTLNPHLSAGTKDLTAGRLTYEPLASFDADGKMVPILAAEEPTVAGGGVSPDGRSVTWKLRQDVHWSDGEPFTADDVAFTFSYITDPEVKSTSLAEYEAVQRVEVVDDHTVTLHFSRVNPAWMAPFTGGQGAILPRHVFADTVGPAAGDAPQNLAPVGTGPFRIVEFTAEDLLLVGDEPVATTKIVYEANPHYREPDKPYFGRVELRGGGGDAVFAAQAVGDGVVDYAWNLAVDEEVFVEMEAKGKARAVVSPGAFAERIMLNFTDPSRETAEGERSSLQFPHPFLTDRTVRQAIALAIDRQTIADNHGRGGTVTSNLVVAPDEYASSNTTWRYDLDAAAALLESAGWVDEDGNGVRTKDGVELRVLFQTSINPVRQQTQALVKQALEQIGFAVELKNIDSSVFLGPVGDSTDTRRHFYADFEMFAFSNKSPDPGAYLRGWTCAEAAQMANNWSRSNWARYCNPDYDRLYEQAAVELDPDRRRELLIALNDFLVEDVALIPLVQQATPVGISTSIQGVAMSPWELDVWNIADWRRE